MKGFTVPSRPELEHAYDALQFETQSLTAGHVTLWAGWARLDARLAEILVRALSRRFRELNPLELWETNRVSASPQALLTLVEFARRRLIADGGIESVSLPSFEVWSGRLSFGVEPAAPQMFFVRDGQLRPEQDLEVAVASLTPYAQWGFFGNADLAFSKRATSRSSSTMMSKSARAEVLQRLINSGRSFSVNDYLAACHGAVHRRTAERDVKEHPLLRPRGRTRARRYIGRPPRGNPVVSHS